MSGLFVKLSTATPNYAPIWVCVRTISTTSPPPQTSSFSILRPIHSRPKLCLFPLSSNNTLHNHFGTRDYSPAFNKDQEGWRVTPCSSSDHLQILGFPFHGHLKSLSSSSSCSFSSRPEGGLGFSDYSGPSSDLKGGILTDMGSENEDQHQQKQRNQSSKLLTLPTILTLGRVASVPLLVCTFYTDSSWGAAATTSIFVAAAITDWLDGYIARKMKLGSAFGAFLDPVADKLMVAATLVLLCTKPLDVAIFGQVPWLLTVPSIIIIGREITMSAVREWAASQNSKLMEAVAVNNLGKWKTATQMTALTILLATRDSSLGAPGVLVGSGILLLYISAGLTFWSLVVYMGKIWKVLLK